MEDNCAQLLRTPRGERLQLQAYLPIAARTLDSSACMDRSTSFLPKLLEPPGLIA